MDIARQQSRTTWQTTIFFGSVECDESAKAESRLMWMGFNWEGAIRPNKIIAMLIIAKYQRAIVYYVECLMY